MFIFDRWHRSSAAVAPVKYECDWNNLSGNFVRSKILLMEKFLNGALLKPIPGQLLKWGMKVHLHEAQQDTTSNVT